jgi:uncharacterized membrane protein
VTALGFVLCVHVVVAVFGTGQVGVLALALVPALRANEAARDGLLVVLRRFILWLNVSLVLLLVTGGILDYLMGRTLHTMWWFRISVLLTLVLGALSGRMGRTVRRATGAGGQVGDAAMTQLSTYAWLAFGVAVAIVALMVLRPW